MALACAPACALDSKSLGEDEGSETAADDSDDSDDGNEGNDSEDSEDGGEPPAPAVELRSQLVEGITPSEIAIAPDGSVYVFGRSAYSYDAEVDDVDYGSAWVGKLDDEGDIEWSFEPGGDGDLNLVAGAAADDGVVLVSSSEIFDVGSTLAHYDLEGEALWSIDLGGELGPWLRGVAIGPDGTIIVVGIGQVGADSSDAYAAAYDGDTGGLLWETDVGTGDVQSSQTHAVAFTSTGDIVIGGQQGVEYLTGRGKAWIATLDAAGTTRWVQTYTEGLEGDSVQDLHVTSDGTIHAVVIENEATTIRRFDADGVQTWSGDPDYTSAVQSIAVADDGSFFASDGRRPELGEPAVALRVASYDANGHARWFDEREDCTLGLDVAILPSGEILVVGGCPPGQGDVEIEMGLFVYAP